MRNQNEILNLKAMNVPALIAEQIAKEIEENIYRPGEMLPSRETLALRYDVHENTIKKAFGILRERGLAQDKVGIGIMVAEPQNKKNGICLIIPSHYQDSQELIGGVEEACKQRQVALDVLTYANAQTQEMFIKKLSHEVYNGAILMPDFSDNVGSKLIKLRKAGFPLVLTGEPIRLDADIAYLDENAFHAAYIGAEHFLENACRRIATVVSQSHSGIAFLDGYRQAMQEYNRLVRDEFVQYVDEDEEPGDATRRLLGIEGGPPSAILYASSKDIQTGCEILKANGIEIGGKVGVICFGDFPGSECCEPPISVLSHDSHETGRKAALLLFSQINETPENDASFSTKLSIRLIARKSSVKPQEGPISLSKLQRLRRAERYGIPIDELQKLRWSDANAESEFWKQVATFGKPMSDGRKHF